MLISKLDEDKTRKNNILNRHEELMGEMCVFLENELWGLDAINSPRALLVAALT